jgi:ribosomal protein L37AE/L43A
MTKLPLKNIDYKNISLQYQCPECLNLATYSKTTKYIYCMKCDYTYRDIKNLPGDLQPKKLTNPIDYDKLDKELKERKND